MKTKLLAVIIMVPFLWLGINPKPAFSKINILYKKTSGSSGEYFSLNNGDVLITGSKVRIRLSNLVAGEYDLILNDPENNEAALSENFKVKAGENIYIPSSTEWLTLGEKSGGFSLVTRNHMGSNETEKFNFVVVPQIENKTLINDKGGNSSKSEFDAIGPLAILRKTDFQNFKDVTSKVNQGFKDGLTRGAGVKIYREKASGVVAVLAEDTDSLGSGMVVNSDGNIITNYHVVKGASTISIIFKPNDIENLSQSYSYSAKLIKYDKGKDLAHLKIISPPTGLTVLTMGDNKNIEIGADVHAIGHPKGFIWTYTRGSISQVRAKHEWTTGGQAHKATVVQTHTPINPGNSGGPLFDDNGFIIGINTYILEGLDGLNFAVSVDDIKEFYQSRNSVSSHPEERREEKAELKVVKKLDTTGSGTNDSFFIDSSGDGEGNFWAVDENEDGKNDYLLMDTDKNGKIDTKIIDHPDYILYVIDTDEDGKYDVAAYDDDKDGKYDRRQTL
jgi:S1-C subfamily serine protease